MKRYLIVDDNADFAENLAEIVRDNGDEVAVASGAVRAIELVREQRFDALVTDMRMPVMNGAGLVHEIRRVDPGLPAIVITAYTDDADLLAARREGLLAVLPKPVPIDVLLFLLAASRRDSLVALVEDDSGLADNLTAALRERGFSAVSASSFAEIGRLGGVQPFAAVVDLRMPGSPCRAALHLLLDRIPELPVLVMSTHGGETDRPAWPSSLSTPFDSLKLVAAVEELWG